MGGEDGCEYTWTLFVPPLQNTVDAGVAALQVTFSLLIVLQTWFSPVQAWLVDRFGPRLLLSIGALLVGASWVLAAPVTSLLGASTRLSSSADGSRAPATRRARCRAPARTGSCWS